MRRLCSTFTLSLMAFLFFSTCVCAADQKLPVKQGSKIVASVNGDIITLDELDRAFASQAEPAQGKKADKQEMLKRLINTRLLIQEGRKMGLEALPEVKNRVDVYAKVTLREYLIWNLLTSVKEPDKKEVEKLYREAIRQWKISDLLFAKEEDAEKIIDDIKQGGNFDELSRQAVAAGKAKRGAEGKYVKIKDVDPAIAGILAKMKIGALSNAIAVKSGFVVVRLEESRSLDSAVEKEQARQEALKQKKLRTMRSYNSELIKKFVRLNEKVLAGIDYEAGEPGFQQLLKDKRFLAEIRGEAPITVGDLTEELRQQLYHGVDRAIESKRLNAKKTATFDEMLYKRMFRKEALRRGLDKSPAYKQKVREYEDSLVFSTFVQKALMPDIKLKEEEMNAYYVEHIGDYTFPAMVRISSLAFTRRNDAESAMEKLRKGTDFQWLLNNMEGQADKNSKGLLEFTGQLVMSDTLPTGVRKATEGLKEGDLRLFADKDSYYYVLLVGEAVPAKTKPYEEAREEIAKKFFDENIRKAMDEWTSKLRAAANIKVYLNLK
jgi:hypothetical protein